MTVRNSIQSAKYDAGQTIKPKIAPLTLAIGSALASGPVLADTITVTSMSGQYESDTCSLRAAIDTLNTGDAGAFTCTVPENPNPTIEFLPSLEGTIELDVDEDGSLNIEESVTIDGDNRITISNQSSGSIIVASSDVGSLSIQGLEITGGSGAGTGGAIDSEANDLEIVDSILSGNENLLGNGGAVRHVPEAGGGLVINDSTFSSNYAINAGGAVYASISDTFVQIEGSTFSNNEALKYGGGGVALEVESGAAFVKYNDFLGNEAGLDDGDGLGGGLFVVLEDSGSSDIKYNEFSGNISGDSGGGMALIAENSSDLGVGYNNFSLNETENSGGGLFAELVNSELLASQLDMQINTSAAGGGGLHVDADSDSAIGLENSLFKYNSTEGRGGAIEITGNPEELGLSYTAFRDNSASGSGGGISIYAPDFAGEALIENSEISGNTVDNTPGGGLYANLASSALLTIRNSTVSGNTGAYAGGGIAQTGSFTAQFKYNTIVDNEASQLLAGGGIYFEGEDEGACIIRNTILANTAGGSAHELAAEDCSVSHSLLAGAENSKYSDGGGNITDVDPELEGLADNDGAGTYTHRPMDGSPVIEAGNPGVNLPEFDQRGPFFDRVSGDELDIGAYEVQVVEDLIFQDRFETN